MLKLSDENLPPGANLPDAPFIATREAILDLLPKLFRPGTCRYSRLDVIEHIIDETVADIGDVWKPKRKKKKYASYKSQV